MPNNADSEYVILFKKYRGQKNGLTTTCPFFFFKTEMLSQEYLSGIIELFFILDNK